ncbi:PAS domain S-box-containing protein [Parasphingorhabdus marina DSM 22363]|uniref:histidine kinase n=1 Tax=Parasphingorhabdus marina DSM 22363 TaxID=1123272 RepID=A0A1N6EK87_9SPHN|nr:PAS domain-containing protein [Parasphingorhabdus marina]SIN83424.1 PAS domain S-box-containing protein [Parasphingorhabdus marina DSM 22363]
MATESGTGRTGERERAHPWYGGVEFRTLAESIPAMVFVSDGNGANIYSNVQVQRFTGMSMEALLGEGWLDAVHPDEQNMARKIWSSSLSTGEGMDTKCRVRRFDGKYRWHLVRSEPVLDAQGHVVRWIGSATDIQDLIAHISIKSQSEAILKALQSSADLVVYAKDAEGRFIYTNAAGLSVIGRRAEEVTGKMVDDLTAETAEGAAIAEHDQQVLAVRRPMTFRESWTLPGADTRYFQSTKVPLPLPDGSVGIAALSVDITVAENQQRQHAETADHLRQRIDSLPHITWVADDEGKLIEVNQAWYDHAGLTPAVGMEYADVIAEESMAAFLDQWSFCLEHGEILDMTVTIRDAIAQKTGERRVLALPVERNISGEMRRFWYGSFS